jgi:hypothetical protein
MRIESEVSTAKARRKRTWCGLRRTLVVIASLEEIDTPRTDHVNDAMFFGQPAGPDIGTHVA